jgi:hypothetical protein
VGATDLSSDGRSFSVHVPLAIGRRGGRKVVLAPDGTAPALPPRRDRVDTAIVRALARAFRWQRMIESGRFATIGDLARSEEVNPSYIARVLRLTLLAPDMVRRSSMRGRPGGCSWTS